MKGWHQKYVITKTDGSPVDPDAVYFVLRLDKDPHAQRAAFAYSLSILKENPALSRDLWEQAAQYCAEAHEHIGGMIPDG